MSFFISLPPIHQASTLLYTACRMFHYYNFFNRVDDCRRTYEHIAPTYIYTYVRGFVFNTSICQNRQNRPFAHAAPCHACLRYTDGERYCSHLLCLALSHALDKLGKIEEVLAAYTKEIALSHCSPISALELVLIK